MLIHEFLNKYPDIFPEATPLIILYSKSDVFMYKNGKDTNHTWLISIQVHFMRNGENVKCTRLTGVKEVCKLADTSTNNVVENDLNTRI